jgi:hypothetical protein
MNAQELIQYQLKTVGFQVERCFEGLPVALYEATVHHTAMSPRLILAHLLEVLEAVDLQLEGKDPQWGGYQANTTPFESLLKQYTARRKDTITRALESSEPQHLQILSNYIVLHESYHVGQLCGLRMAQDPTFDPFSIYQHS